MGRLTGHRTRRRWDCGTVLVLVLATCSVLSACTQSASGKVIDLGAVETRPLALTAFQGSDDVLRLAVAPVYSPQTTLDMYQALRDYLGSRLNRRAELIPGKTYGEINDLIRAGEVTLAIVCTNAYLEGQEDFGGDGYRCRHP